MDKTLMVQRYCENGLKASFTNLIFKKDNNGVFAKEKNGEKFKPITSRSKKILGKIKMNLKQNVQEEVRTQIFVFI